MTATIDALTAVLLAPAQSTGTKKNYLGLLRTALQIDPAFADADMAERTLNLALNGGWPGLRFHALLTFSVIIKTRPDLITEAMIDGMKQLAAPNEEDRIREYAHKLLEAAPNRTKCVPSASPALPRTPSFT